MIHLYIKTHNTTGLKYFGKTVQDPYKYKGSGTYWIRHLKEHGNDVTTEILGSFSDKTEALDAAIRFSESNDIVHSKQWANLKLETLDGGFDHINSNPDLLRAIYDKRQGSGNSMYGRKHRTDSKEKISSAKSGVPLGAQSAEHKEKRRKAKCMTYELISPNGDQFITDDLPTFCADHGIPYKTIYKIAKHKRHPKTGACVGWRCERVLPCGA